MASGVRLSAEAQEIQAGPGDQVTVRVQVRNSGSGPDSYRLAVSGLPRGWASLSPARLALAAGASGTAQVAITIPVGSAPSSPQQPLTLTATSEADPQVQASTLVLLVLAPGGGLRLTLTPAQVRGRTGAFAVRLGNGATAPVTVRLAAHDPQGALTCTLTPPTLTVGPGEEASARVAVTLLARETVGAAHSYPVLVEATPEGVPAGSSATLRAQGLFVAEPRVRAGVLPVWVRRLPGWALLLGALLLLGAAFGAGVGARNAGALTSALPTPTAPASPTGSAVAGPTGTVGPRHPAPPRISVLSVAPLGSGSGPGGPVRVRVTWASSGGSRTTLDGQPVAASGSRTLAVGGSSPQTLVLAVAGPGGSTSQTVRIEPAFAAVGGVPHSLAPYLPRITRFSLSRGPGRTMVLAWSVQSADRVAVQGRAVPTSGTAPAQGDGPYALVASNRYGQVTSTLALPAHAGGPIHYQPVLHGPTIGQFALVGGRLVWTTSGAQTVRLNGKPVSTNGSLAVGTPGAGSVYDLVATSGALTSRAEVRVALAGGTQPSGQRSYVLSLPVISAFNVSTSSGQPVVTWQVQGATHVALDGQAVPASGSQAVAGGTTSLTLVAGNDVGTQSRQIPLVGPTPTFAPTAIPPTTLPTAKPTGTPTKAVPPASPTHTPGRAATATTTPRPGSTATPTRVRTSTPIPTSTSAGTPRATATGTVAGLVPNHGHPGLAVATFTPTLGPGTPSPTRARPATWTRTPTVGGPRPSATPSTTAPPGSTSTATPTLAPGTTSTATNTPRPGSTATTTGTPSASATSTRTSTPTATGTPAPGTLTVAPTSLHFPTGSAGSAGYSAQTVTVTNSGPAAVTISQVSLTGPDAAAFNVSGCADASLAAQGACTLRVTFTSNTPDKGDSQGNYTASVQLTDTATGSPQSVALSAGPRTIAANPTSASIAATTCNPQCTGSTTITVTNQGPGPLAGVSAAFSPSVPGLTADTTACAGAAMFATCPVVVTYAPGGVSAQPTSTPQSDAAPLSLARAAGLAASGGDPATTLTLTPLGGSGAVSVQINASSLPNWTISPNSPVTLNTNNAQQIFIITNNGPGTLTNLQFTLADNTNFNLQREFEGPGCGNSQGGGVPNGARPLAETLPGNPLAPGQSCWVGVNFNPTGPGGPFPTTLTVSANGIPPSYTIQITGQLPSWTLTPNGSVTIPASGSQTPASQSFTVTNNGPGTLQFTDGLDNGTDGFNFGESTCPSGYSAAYSLAAGVSCQIVVTFVPNASGSSFPSGLYVVTPDGNPGKIDVSLTGTQPATTASITPNNVTCEGTCNFFVGNPLQFTITNTGSYWLDASGVSVTPSSSNPDTNGSYFTISGNTCTANQQPGSTCTFSVGGHLGSGDVVGSVSMQGKFGVSTLTVNLDGNGG